MLTENTFKNDLSGILLSYTSGETPKKMIIIDISIEKYNYLNVKCTRY